MFELQCKTCERLIGQTSIENDITHECGQCYEAREFENALRAGFNFDAHSLSDEKMKAIIGKVADEMPEIFVDVGFNSKVEAIAKKHPKVIAIRDEQMRIGLEQAAEAERTKEKSPTGTTIFI